MTDARRLWQLFEPVHALTYFDPIAREPLEALGIGGFWNTYVVARAAPLGPVGPAPVTAAFFAFHPKRAAAILPEVWDRLTPEQVLQARATGAADALRLHLEDPEDNGLLELADVLWRASQQADCAGRVLAAANQAIERPTEPLDVLWQATTTLREHRGDGHLAVLISLGLGPIEAMLLKIAAGESEARDLQLGRGWDDETWGRAVARLDARGLTQGGELTSRGRVLREQVEQATDEAAAQPWAGLPVHRAVTGLAPIAASIWASNVMPASNPVGLARR